MSFYQISMQSLLIDISLQIVSCSRKAKDQYGREVAVCSLVSPFGSQDLNEWLVTNGYAVAYRFVISSTLCVLLLSYLL